jgi:hypothetical protein
MSLKTCCLSSPSFQFSLERQLCAIQLPVLYLFGVAVLILGLVCFMYHVFGALSTPLPLFPFPEGDSEPGPLFSVQFDFPPYLAYEAFDQGQAQ